MNKIAKELLLIAKNLLSENDLKAIADKAWDYFEQEEQYQQDRREIHGTPREHWLETDKNLLTHAEKTGNIPELQKLLAKYKKLDEEARKKASKTIKGHATMKKHDIVRWSKPQNEEEKDSRFVLLDDPEEMTRDVPYAQQRINIQFICDMNFKPIETVHISEIEPAPEGGNVCPNLNLEVVLSSAPNADFGETKSKSPKQRVKVRTLEEAKEVCLKYIAKYDLGSGNWTGGRVYQGKYQYARIHYNGKIQTQPGNLY